MSGHYYRSQKKFYTFISSSIPTPTAQRTVPHTLAKLTMVLQIALLLHDARRLDGPGQHQLVAAMTLGTNVASCSADKSAATLAAKMAESNPLFQRNDRSLGLAALAGAVPLPSPPRLPAQLALVVGQATDGAAIVIIVTAKVDFAQPAHVCVYV